MVIHRHPTFERNSYLQHFLAYGILPECVAVFFADSVTVVACLRYLDTKPVSPFKVSLVGGRDNSVPSLEGEWNPPSKGRFGF